ncbi:MAG: putative pterin-4-alpha-carbinolamine dehydratase 1 [Candidatus Binatia bacterium]|nr:MAG: putative pterin-4-alpha-carbinolamine dehydratase 1 [Candidatus Binatia bacterium]
MKLSERTCTPTGPNTPKLPPEEWRRLLEELPGWHVVDDHHLYKRYSFPDFASALAAVQQVGAVAEAQGHHPDITLRWGEVELRIWTHVVGGLTENDFILAAKCDEVLTRS